MSLLEKVSEQMKEAMRAKEAVRLGALRLIKSELKKTEIDQATELTDEMGLKVIGTMAKQARDSIEQFRSGDRDDLAEKEEAELAVIEAFLPEAISEEQVERIIEETLADISDIDPGKIGMVIGKVMGAIKATGLTFDGKAVNERVRQRLSS